MSTPLERLAQRVQADDFFLAASLARYAKSQQLDDAALAAALGCDAATLPSLRLCRNPDPQPPAFWQDIEKISARFQLDAGRLAEIVRFGQGLLQVKTPGEDAVSEAPGFLMAAREDDTEQEPPAGEEQ